MKDHCALQIRSNHGIGIIASLFGCASSIFNNEMPWVHHIPVEKARKVFARGVPDLEGGLGKRVIETYRYYHERLRGYPRSREAIRITQPDLQGPFDIFPLVLGSDCFVSLYDDPEFCRKALEVIVETYCQFRELVGPLLTDGYGGDAVFAHGFLCGGRVLLKVDTAAINLSREMYRQLEKAGDARIFEHFGHCGGGSPHYCGPPREWHLAEMSDARPRSLTSATPKCTRWRPSTHSGALRVSRSPAGAHIRAATACPRSMS
jgi:hypothetical protein